MSRELDYLVKIEGNEALLERFIDAINNNTCKADKKYPNPYVLDTGERFLNTMVLQYFFKTRPFSKELYIDYFEKLRKLSGFNSYDYALGEQINNLVCITFERVKKNKYKIFIPEGNEAIANKPLSDYEKELLSFVCYLAVCHIKYGPSYASVKANQYFDVVTGLGSGEVEKLKKIGTGNLPKELTNYKDKTLTCEANDVFATIKIKMANDEEETYRKALLFINNLLKTDFPESYEISFSSNNKQLLPIKGLPKCGQNYLFAGAVQFPNLHQEILEYISLAKKEHEWYNNVEDENCAMPSTFAVFALGLDDEKYVDVVIDYLQTVDDEHQSIQEKFTPVFLERFGLNESTVKVYVNCILSMQEHPPHKLFPSYFANEKGLKLLLNSKENFAEYYFTEEALKDFEDSGNDVQEMADYCWESVMYTTFGKKPENIIKQLTPAEKEIFEKLK
ncbi:hypothetical protein J2X31_001323 [Flavobacterium arsenatis]|uniref:Uncharacterized protein n=1 Tax=Flavobacterium arsenatis TaxID=1484332 RepID=A0ABU1TN70_9FLAO|nr:DUF6138 family protein [Flavobacterium arsenatis]MDR6967316.1 hypothetical protein [Flavobacterium arsenatis]